jgi:hypothetical protein
MRAIQFCIPKIPKFAAGKKISEISFWHDSMPLDKLCLPDTVALRAALAGVKEERYADSTETEKQIS